MVTGSVDDSKISRLVASPTCDRSITMPKRVHFLDYPAAQLG